MLTEKESDRLLTSWNDTAADYPRGCIHKLARCSPWFHFPDLDAKTKIVKVLHGDW